MRPPFLDLIGYRTKTALMSFSVRLVKEIVIFPRFSALQLDHIILVHT